MFKALERAQLAQNINGASQVNMGLQAYAMEHGRFPPDLEALESGGYVPSLEAVSYRPDKNTMLDWIYHPGLDHNSDYSAIVLASPETLEQRRETSRIVGRVDGSVSVIPELDCQTLIREQESR